MTPVPRRRPAQGVRRGVVARSGAGDGRQGCAFVAGLLRPMGRGRHKWRPYVCGWICGVVGDCPGVRGGVPTFRAFIAVVVGAGIFVGAQQRRCT